MLSECEGSVRRAFSEPSIGSTIDADRRPPVAEGDLAALLGDRRELVPLGVQALELGEDDVLASAVDDQGAVAALADSRVDGAGRDPALLGEQLALGGDHRAGRRRANRSRPRSRSARRRPVRRTACAPSGPC